MKNLLQIRKYNLESKSFLIRDAIKQFLYAGLDAHGEICVWALADISKSAEKKDFIMHCCWTGDIGENFGTYIDTIVDRNTGLVWHVFYEE